MSYFNQVILHNVAVSYVICFHLNFRGIEVLLKDPFFVNPNMLNKHGVSALWLAAKYNFVDMGITLLQFNSDPEFQADPNIQVKTLPPSSFVGELCIPDQNFNFKPFQFSGSHFTDDSVALRRVRLPLGPR